MSPRSDRDAARLARDGYCIVERALAPATLGELAAELAPRFAATPMCQGDFYGMRTKRFGALLARSRLAEQLVMQPLVLEIVEEMLLPWCERIALNLAQAIEIHPGALPQLPHRDQDMWAGPKGGLEYLVNVMWPLDPFTRENGGTRLWPGSHVDPDIHAYPEADAIVPRLMPGDALLFLGSTLHGGGGNVSTGTRRGIVISYLSAKEARRAARGDGPESAKLARPEVTSTMQTYLDLHRHAAVRAALLGHPGIALRLMVAHAIGGSHLWRVSPEPQTTRNDEVRESIETCRGETLFDERRRAVLAVLDFSSEEPTVTGGNGDDYGVAGIFLRLIDLPDAIIMEIITVIMGETLASGSAAVAAVGTQIDVDMADWWQADTAFFELIRDKEVLSRIVAEVAGETVATANAGEKTKTLKRIVCDHLAGSDGRTKVERWVPKWLGFPASAYTARGGVGTVAAHAKVEAARDMTANPDPDAGQEPFAQAA